MGIANGGLDAGEFVHVVDGFRLGWAFTAQQLLHVVTQFLCGGDGVHGVEGLAAVRAVEQERVGVDVLDIGF